MRKWMILLVVLFAMGTAAAGDEVTTGTEELGTSLQECPLEDGLELEPLGNGKGGGGSACCNPDNEPGVGGNPLCFEGHTCCDDGQWRCNNPDGSPSCEAGEVCAAGCGDRNDTCDTGDDCCSGNCKRGRCR